MQIQWRFAECNITSTTPLSNIDGELKWSHMAPSHPIIQQNLHKQGENLSNPNINKVITAYPWI